MKRIGILVLILAFCFGAGFGYGAYQTKIYRDQSGNRETVDNGGTYRVLSGGTLDVQAGATFNLLSRKVVLTSYAADPQADSVKIGVAGQDATDPVFVTMNTDRPDSLIYVTSAVSRNDTVTVFFNMDPGKSVKFTLLSLQD